MRADENATDATDRRDRPCRIGSGMEVAMQEWSKVLVTRVWSSLVLLGLPACSTAAAELWPVDEAPAPTVVDVRLVPRTSSGRADTVTEEATFEVIASAVASSPGSRVRVYEASCPAALVLDETAPEFPVRPRAIPRHIECEAARLTDRLREASAEAAPRRREVCVAEAITLAAGADALVEADEVHVVVVGPLVEDSRFARLVRGRLPTARMLERRANAQRLLPVGSLAGARVHLAGRVAPPGMSFGRSEAIGELWLGLLNRAGAHDVMVTSGAPVLDDGVAPDAGEEE
jgi:hypothetical protein